MCRERISSTVHEAMHVFWDMMENFANTLIFLFTGLKIAIMIYEENNVEIHAEDWGWAILLYVVLNVRLLAWCQLINVLISVFI